LKERIQHTNRIRGLLFGQGIDNYDPIRSAHGWRSFELETVVLCRII
jgi:transposase